MVRTIIKFIFLKDLRKSEEEYFNCSMCKDSTILFKKEIICPWHNCQYSTVINKNKYIYLKKLFKKQVLKECIDYCQIEIK